MDRGPKTADTLQATNTFSNKKTCIFWFNLYLCSNLHDVSFGSVYGYGPSRWSFCDGDFVVLISCLCYVIECCRLSKMYSSFTCSKRSAGHEPVFWTTPMRWALRGGNKTIKCCTDTERLKTGPCFPRDIIGTKAKSNPYFFFHQLRNCKCLFGNWATHLFINIHAPAVHLVSTDVL